jgi:hypothetical protein
VAVKVEVDQAEFGSAIRPAATMAKVLSRLAIPVTKIAMKSIFTAIPPLFRVSICDLWAVVQRVIWAASHDKLPPPPPPGNFNLMSG